MNLIEKAIEIALNAHVDQKDRYGQPYILHPLRVMMKVDDEKEKVAAILHDVIEDSDYEYQDLCDKGFPPEIIEAVVCLSKQDGEEYIEYIKRAISNPISIKVKLADLEDNMDIRRIDVLQERDIERFNRYLKAWRMIKKI